MKLQATVGEFNTDVALDVDGARVVATVGERKYQLQLHRSAASEFLLSSDGRVFNCRIEGQPASGRAVEVVVGSNRRAVTLTDPKRLRGADSAGAHAGGAAIVTAPMPGKVVRVMVEVGAAVEAGAGLLVVEAMKMQNEMKSPKAGTVATLNVEVGATVNGGDVLVVIE